MKYIPTIIVVSLLVVIAVLILSSNPVEGVSYTFDTEGNVIDYEVN